MVYHDIGFSVPRKRVLGQSLVLSRKIGEKIIVKDGETGETLSVTLVDIVMRNNVPVGCRIGFEASRRFNIAREEVYDGD